MRRSLVAAGVALLLLAMPVSAQLFPTNPFPDQPAPQQLAPADLGAFVGGWYGHGRGLTIDASGQAEYRYRIYTWCTPGMTVPCDRIDDHIIQNGGSADFTFTSADGPILHGRIDEANDRTRFPKGGAVRFEVRENGLAELTWGDTSGGPGITLCGARFADAPEDVRRTYPCGA